MVTGRKATADDRGPITVGDHQIECVTEILYLGSVTASSGRMQPDIELATRASPMRRLTKVMEGCDSYRPEKNEDPRRCMIWKGNNIKGGVASYL